MALSTMSPSMVSMPLPEIACVTAGEKPQADSAGKEFQAEFLPSSKRLPVTGKPPITWKTIRQILARKNRWTEKKSGKRKYDNYVKTHAMTQTPFIVLQESGENAPIIPTYKKGPHRHLPRQRRFITLGSAKYFTIMLVLQENVSSFCRIRMHN